MCLTAPELVGGAKTVGQRASFSGPVCTGSSADPTEAILPVPPGTGHTNESVDVHERAQMAAMLAALHQLPC